MESKLNTYRSWLEFLQRVESYFTKKSFLKVRTPNLVPSGAMESSLHPFLVEGGDFQLPTSPEFSLKKLWLSGLSSKIFELSPSFRAEEPGPSHLAEFTMLEFYQAEASFEELIYLSQSFLSHFLQLEPKQLRVLKMNEAFHTCTGFELRPDSSESFLREVLNFHGLVFPEQSSWSDLFHLLLIDKIEPVLSRGFTAFVNYPPQLAALAKINEQGWADRVEFFCGGVELGNGYNELIDADEILNRWNKENTLRKREGREAHPVDSIFIDAHRAPQMSSGVGMAIGLERLFWLTRSSAGEHIGVWPFGGPDSET